jgi:flagellar basal body-associated protein FliL
MNFINKNQFLALFVAAFLALSFTPAHASEGAEDSKMPAKGPMYVDFKNIVVPVIKKDGRTGVIALAIMAEVANQDDNNEVTGKLPRLRDAFIRALYGNMESNDYVRADGALDIDHIKDRLMKTAAYVMKDEKENPIKDILFQNIAQQGY